MNETELVIHCDVCNAVLEGEPAGRGLLLWVRGDEIEREEPALCDKCALAVSMTALWRWETEEDEG